MLIDSHASVNTFSYSACRCINHGSFALNTACHMDQDKVSSRKFYRLRFSPARILVTLTFYMLTMVRQLFFSGGKTSGPDLDCRPLHALCRSTNNRKQTRASPWPDRNAAQLNGGGEDTQDSAGQKTLRSKDLQGANLVAAAKPLLTPGSARWSDRFSMGP